MDKNQINIKDDKKEDESIIKYMELLDLARQYTKLNNYQLGQFYVCLANLEPDLDINNKIKAEGILSFIRIKTKNNVNMDDLTFKILKYLNSENKNKVEKDNISCIIRILYRGGMARFFEGNYLSSLYLLNTSINLFKSEKTTPDDGKDQIITTYQENKKKFLENVRK